MEFGAGFVFFEPRFEFIEGGEAVAIFGGDVATPIWGWGEGRL